MREHATSASMPLAVERRVAVKWSPNAFQIGSTGMGEGLALSRCIVTPLSALPYKPQKSSTVAHQRVLIIRMYSNCTVTTRITPREVHFEA